MSQKECPEALRRLAAVGEVLAVSEAWTADQIREALEAVLAGQSPWYLKGAGE